LSSKLEGCFAQVAKLTTHIDRTGPASSNGSRAYCLIAPTAVRIAADAFSARVTRKL
jgi:hypothetical protein